MAEAIGCQVAYISHVLSGERDFSVEQAEGITRFFAMTSDESEYFIWLVEKERAGTTQTKTFFEKLLQQKKDKYLQLKNRVNISYELDDIAKATYYSDYLYSAIHMIVTIPKFQTPNSISEALGISLKKTSQILEFLKAHGLITESSGKLISTSKYLFIDKNSPFIIQHHTNWKMQSLQNARKNDSSDLHLSMTVTLSEKDSKLLQRRISEFIEEISETIKVSNEEKLMAIGIDFFHVTT
jgi:uncharacterized protein (TIGR02147 family)